MSGRQELKRSFENTFLGCILERSPKYRFMPHLEYFMKSKHRWSNSNLILERVFANVPADVEEAWETWRKFRSAQAEITTIFLIEVYLGGIVKDLEVSPPGTSRRCDIFAALEGADGLYLEVKAQSGQQHGDKHPCSQALIRFEPRADQDLRSWLFEEKVSSRDGKPMRPYCLQASDKSADGLVVMTDIFWEDCNDMKSLARLVIPDFESICSIEFPKNYLKLAATKGLCFTILQWLRLRRETLRVTILRAGEESLSKMRNLRELWIFDNSEPHDLVIIQGKKSSLSVRDASDA